MLPHCKSGEPETTLAVIVLAAGLGKRFGGDKLQAEYQGKKLFLYTLEKVGRLPAACRILVGKDEKLRSEAGNYGCSYCQNPYPEKGQSGSLILGLQQALREAPEITGALFMVCDQPWLSMEFLRKMCGRIAQPQSAEQPLPPRQRILCACAEGRRGNPVYFGRDYFPELLALTGDIGGRPVLLRHPEAVSLCEARQIELEDVDYRCQLERRADGTETEKGRENIYEKTAGLSERFPEAVHPGTLV